jgi:hypothetical protein
MEIYFMDTRFSKIYIMTYGSILEKTDFEIEVFAQEKQCWNSAEWQRIES